MGAQHETRAAGTDLQSEVTKARPTALDFADPRAVRRWLDDVQESTDDVIAVAHDQTKPLAQRDLGRARAIHILKAATESVTNLLVFARRGLPPTPVGGGPRRTG